MHVHIVLCCGAKTVLFINKLSESSCHIINPYLFTKFHTSKHLGKRVRQTCMEKHVYSILAKKDSHERKERNQEPTKFPTQNTIYTIKQTNNERQDPGCPALRTGAVG